MLFFFFSSRRRHTRLQGDWSSDVCSSDLTTRMRTHVEVDPLIGMRGVEGVQALVDEYQWAIDIELCVMPQEGLTNNPGRSEERRVGKECRSRWSPYH